MFAVGKTIGQADIDKKQAINKPGKFYSQSGCVKNWLSQETYQK